MLAVEYYYHNLVGKASQGDTFYVIFSDFLKMYKTLKELKTLKKSLPMKHSAHTTKHETKQKTIIRI